MILSQNQYFQIRTSILNHPQKILEIEEHYTQFFLNILSKIIEDIHLDFTENTHELLPFWQNYPPEQRGRKPTGTAIPLLELGEKTISFHLLKSLTHHLPDINFPGLPSGGDIRFSTKDALIHLDIKLTGPNDNSDELVVPPNQVSGDGQNWKNEGVFNSVWPVLYQTGTRKGRINYHFHPKLPPFYVLHSQTLLCLTFFIKAVYRVEDFGIQPLVYMELVCVPNGLLLFENDRFAETEGLIIAGKDEKSKAENTLRIRIRLNTLATLHRWRAIKLKRLSEKYITQYRADDLI